MASRKIKLFLAGLALSLMMTTGVQAAQEPEKMAEPAIQEETAVEDTEEETDLSKEEQDTTGADDMNETESAEEEVVETQPAEESEADKPDEESDSIAAEEVPDNQENQEVNTLKAAEQETGAAPAALEAGWQELEGGIRYCEADETGKIRPVTGWQEIDGITNRRIITIVCHCHLIAPVI